MFKYCVLDDGLVNSHRRVGGKTVKRRVGDKAPCRRIRETHVRPYLANRGTAQSARASRRRPGTRSRPSRTWTGGWDGKRSVGESGVRVLVNCHSVMSICHSNSYRGNSITGTVSIYHSTPVSVTRSARRNCVRTSHCKSYKYWQYYMHHDLRTSQVVHSKRAIKQCVLIWESPDTNLEFVTKRPYWFHELVELCRVVLHEQKSSQGGVKYGPVLGV